MRKLTETRCEEILEWLGSRGEDDRFEFALSVSEADRLSLHDVGWWGVKLAALLAELRERAMERPHIALRSWLREAMEPGEPFAEVTLAAAPRAPRWPAAQPEVDRVCGGFYGVTVLAGETGCGKSTWAAASAFEAALAGQYVVYLNAELDAPTLAWFVSRYFGPLAAEREAALARMRFVNVRPGISCAELGSRLAMSVPTWAERMLVVLDSVNTICELAQDADGFETYFKELRRWLLWAMEARRLSAGKIGFLVVSELNAKGETKGRKADYVADLVFRLQRGESDGYVKVACVKGRYSGRHDFGALYLNHRTGRLEGAPVPEPTEYASDIL